MRNKRSTNPAETRKLRRQVRVLSRRNKELTEGLRRFRWAALHAQADANRVKKSIDDALVKNARLS